MANMFKDGKVLCTEASYAKKLRKKSDHALRYILADARESSEALPECRNVEFYKTEVRLAQAEIDRRDEEAANKYAAEQERYMEQMMLHGGES